MSRLTKETEAPKRPLPLLELVLSSASVIVLVPALIARSVTIMTTAFLVLSVMALFRFYYILREPKEYWSVCNILACVTCFSYSMGYVLTVLLGEYGLPGVYFQPDSRTLDSIGYAFLYVLLFYWALVIASYGERRFWTPVFANIERKTGDESPLFLAIFVVLTGASQLYLLFAGEWSYMGFLNSERGEVPTFAALVGFVATAIVGLCGWVIGRGISRVSLTVYVIVVAMVPIQVLWFGAGGRRMLAYGIIVFVIFFLWERRRAPRINHLFLGAIVSVFIMYFASEFFLAMRYVVQTYGGEEVRAPVKELLTKALEVARFQGALLGELQAQNLGNRFYIIGYLSHILDKLTWNSSQFGLHLAMGFLIVIPRVVFPGKTDIIQRVGQAEDILNPSIGLEATDMAWSVLVSAYADFMWLGLLIYPLLFLGIGAVLALIIRSLGHGWAVVLGLSAILFTFLSAEAVLGHYLLVVRTVLGLWVITVVLRAATMKKG